MKKFTSRLFVFLIPVIAVIALWEYGLSQIQNSYSLKRMQLETQAPKIEVLVLGPSHALRGVNPEYFSMKGYNAANIEQSLFYDTRITLKYLDKLSALKVVLIDISYTSLWHEVINAEESFRDYFYADYWGIRYPAIKWYDIHIYSKILLYGNTKAWQYALKGFNVNLVNGYSDNGWATKDGEESPINDSAGYAFMRDHKKNFKEENLGHNIQYLNDLLKELKSRKIQAVFYSPPFTASSYKYMDANRLKTIDSVLHDLCTTYNCKWYDYHKDPRFFDSDFKNLGHLNQDGSTKFSKIINEEILKNYNNPKANQ
jgi:hypothetical protein